MILIVQQPEVNKVLPAYKPVVISCKATTNEGNVPALVFCDVYVNSRYYRTFFSSKSDREGIYDFDIQDAMQELFNYFIPPMDGKKIEISKASIKSVYVKIRTSKINDKGLSELEQTAPIPGTDDSAPIGGGGTPSNQFFVLNAIIQHEEQQDLLSLLGSYKTDQWSSGSYPLTKRNRINTLTSKQSSFFPFITDKEVKKLRLIARLKGKPDFRTYDYVVNPATDINEEQYPPTINIKWLKADNKETTGTVYWDPATGTPFPSLKIKFYVEDLDGDIAKVELFRYRTFGEYVSLGEIQGDTHTVSEVTVEGLYEYKAVVTDQKNNSVVSNILSLNVGNVIIIPW